MLRAPVEILALMLLTAACDRLVDPPVWEVLCVAEPYRVETRGAGAPELRLFRSEHHFGTLVIANGTLNFRPHPSLHPDAWGTSVYLMPHLPGATLTGASLEVACTPMGLTVEAGGVVNRGAAANIGPWEASLTFRFEADAREVIAEGPLVVHLEQALDDATGDLNVVRIASNYLQDVPLLGGGEGDTGDMARVRVTGDGFAFDWIPDAQPAHFPIDTTTTLSLDVIGQTNSVDTERQGYPPIHEAPKPTVTLRLATPLSILTFGGQYDLAHARDFWEDNVGVTPLVCAPNPSGDLRFELVLRATP